MRMFLVGMWMAAWPLSAQMRFEAETVVVNKDALRPDSFGETHWNLWSNDPNKKAWSGGVTIQSPVVRQDRASPEEGAPPLHIRLTAIPNGTYDVSFSPNRVLGVSRDGKEWKRHTGGCVCEGIAVTDGVIEFFIDDMFAMADPKRQGSGYVDVILVTPSVSFLDGIANADFESTNDQGAPSQWGWWTREPDTGRVESSADAHGGECSVHIRHDGAKDWAYTNGVRYKVEPGSELCLKGWAKGTPVTLSATGFRDGKHVTYSLAVVGSRGPSSDWRELKGYFSVPSTINGLTVRVTGAGRTDAWVDDIAVTAERFTIPPKPKVRGWATKRVEPRIDRGVVAQRRADNSVYISWRLLESDPAGIAFEVFRSAEGLAPVQVTETSVTRTTDCVDVDPGKSPLTYTVRPVNAPGACTGSAVVLERLGDETPSLRLKLSDASVRVSKLGIADLDGDGVFDYVVKHPQSAVDPYKTYWRKSPDTFKIEAYLADGTALWRHDLGWAVEQGVWYSPYIVYDLDGDGKAEVAAKVGPVDVDPRDEDGRVNTGPEWLVVWNGMTGAEIARAPWPSRDGFSGYNTFSRNQIAVAFLDGKTPCLLPLRGTYGLMKADAYQLRDGQLEQLWTYSSEELPRQYRGQGAHFCLCADVDGDGRDEVSLGSVMLDDNGVPLWTTGRGHPDAHYLSDIDPARPGMEIAYVMESRQLKGGGLHTVDAATGELLWKLDVPTGHVHGSGICADLDPRHPGLEVYGADSADHKQTGARWLFAANGALLKSGDECPYGFGLSTVYWDADLQHEVAGGHVTDYEGGAVSGRIRGSRVLVADILGDWREEIVTCEGGELRVYTTDVSAMDRRVCLMQDPVYRGYVAMSPMGYTKHPTLSYNPETVSPNLSLTRVVEADVAAVRVVVAAAYTTGLKGTVQLSSEQFRSEPETFAFDLEPGERVVRSVAVVRIDDAAEGLIRAVLNAGDVRLIGQVQMKAATAFLQGVPMAQAEAFSDQTGGSVHIRTDKPGVMGKAFSHWDDAGHRLGWRLSVAEPGRYKVVVRYSTPSSVQRRLTVDGKDVGTPSLPSTGGFGGNAFDWAHADMALPAGPIALDLTAGDHSISLENVDGKGCNLDYLALVPLAR